MALPDWLEHYRYLPAWVVLHDHGRILWVNERVAQDNGAAAEWFVGRRITDLWTLGAIEPMAAGVDHLPDAVVDVRDRRGRLRWLLVHRTRVDAGSVLVVARDVTAELKLHGLRLLLGRTLATGSRAALDEALARQLLEGRSLDDICAARGTDRAAALSQLALLVAAGPPEPQPSFAPPPLHAHLPPPGDLPDWLAHYEDLPVLAAVIDHPELRVRWANEHALAGAAAESVIGRPLEELLADARSLRRLCDRAIAERRAVDGIGAVRLRGDRLHWLVCRTTPLGGAHLLVVEDDVTAEIRLQALRLLLGVDAAPARGAPPAIDSSFAQLLLAGADVANLCAGLELAESQVLSRIGELVGAHGA
jgi:hypothetical protein